MEKFADTHNLINSLDDLLKSKQVQNSVLVRDWIVEHGEEIIISWLQLYKIAESAETLIKRIDKLDKLEKALIEFDHSMRLLKKLARKIQKEDGEPDHTIARLLGD